MIVTLEKVREGAMDNPFRYGELVTGAYFTNRQEELAELEQDLRSGQNVVIMSPRRYGKTSLILRVIDRLRQQGVLVAYLDLFGTPTKASFTQALAQALNSGLLSPYQQKLKGILDAFRGLSVTPKLSMGEDGTPTLELAPGRSEADLDRDIEVLLAMPAKIAKEKGRRVVLILDEFQEIVGIDKHLVALMRSVFQHQAEVSHVYLGSKFHLMNDLFNNINEPMYKSAKSLPLQPFQPEAFAAFILERFESTGKRVSDEAIDRMLAITACHPSDTQQLAHFTWALCQARGIDASTAIVNEALSKIVAAEDARYTLLWDELSARQKTLLMALSRGSGSLFSESYRRDNQLGPASSVQGALARLKEKELVEVRKGDEYAITDTYLRYWIKQVMLKQL